LSGLVDGVSVLGVFGSLIGSVVFATLFLCLITGTLIPLIWGAILLYCFSYGVVYVDKHRDL